MCCTCRYAVDQQRAHMMATHQPDDHAPNTHAPTHTHQHDDEEKERGAGVAPPPLSAQIAGLVLARRFRNNQKDRERVVEYLFIKFIYFCQTVSTEAYVRLHVQKPLQKDPIGCRVSISGIFFYGNSIYLQKTTRSSAGALHCFSPNKWRGRRA